MQDISAPSNNASGDLISVIIPAWNRAAFLADAIESVNQQRHEALEIIVIDDGSTDDTRKIAEQLKGNIRYILQPHRGVAAARNAGIKAARGNIIAFLDTDDLWPPYKLNIQLDALKNGAFEMVLGASRIVKLCENRQEPFVRNNLSPTFSYHLSSGLYQRSVFDKIGLFDERLTPSDDVDWFLRAQEAEVRALILSQETVIWRQHDNNISVGKSIKELNLFKVLKGSVDRRSNVKKNFTAFRTFEYQKPDLMEEPLISVVVPVCNGARFLAMALRSIFDQFYRNFEVIVVDDGSDDNSAEIIGSFPKITAIRQKRKGVATARNTGIDAARGEFIAFLDQDDLWMPSKLCLQIACHLKNSNIGYSLTGEKIFIEPGSPSPAWLRREMFDDHIGHVLGAIMIKKNIFERVGLFDPAYEIVSDADWLFRAKDAGITAYQLTDTLLLRRIHQNNVTHRQSEMRAELMRSLKASVDRQNAAKGRPLKPYAG